MTANQFTLRSMIVATAFVAIACYLAAHLLGDDDLLGWLLALVALPILLGSAVGVLRRDVFFWLGCAYVVVIAEMGAMLLWVMIERS
jgi:hypothetical protein